MDILLISGSTRAASTNTAMLRTVAALAEPGTTAELYGRLATLPAFTPDDDRDQLPGPVAALCGRIHRTDALLFCTPEYAACLRLPLARDAVGPDGLIADPAARAGALTALAALFGAAQDAAAP